MDAENPNAGLKVIEDLTANAAVVQEQVLSEILAKNAETAYLGMYLVDVDVDTWKQENLKQQFKLRVPVVEYRDMKPYIDMIAAGEPSNIISAGPITELLSSSGTSGGLPKLLPSTAEELERKMFFGSLVNCVMNKWFDGLDQGKMMIIRFVNTEFITPGGIVARQASTSFYKSRNFESKPHDPFNVNASPDSMILCPDTKQSLYCQLLCGLVQRHEVIRVGAFFASTFLRALKFLQANWEEMCSNIRTGRVSEWVTDPLCRAAVDPLLAEPNPGLAKLIQEICSVSTWEGMVKKLWPRTKYVESIVTGSMAQHIPLLEFYGGGIHLVSGTYALSECCAGINLNPLCEPGDVSYTLIPNMAYFEFLPVGETDHSDGSSKTVDLVDVKLGHCYELVVCYISLVPNSYIYLTKGLMAGLYRYRVGDILMVTGFHNKVPQFRFVQRQNVALSIDIDKTSEEDLQKAVKKAKQWLEPLGLILTEYTSYADTSSIPGHYVIFWELETKGNSDRLPKVETGTMEQCCFTIEESLDFTYRMCRRRDKAIGPLEIRVVQRGSFDELMDFCLAEGLCSMNQYKTPKCIKTEATLGILNKRATGWFFSLKAPSWELLDE